MFDYILILTFLVKRDNFSELHINFVEPYSKSVILLIFWVLTEIDNYLHTQNANAAPNCHQLHKIVRPTTEVQLNLC